MYNMSYRRPQPVCTHTHTHTHTQIYIYICTTDGVMITDGIEYMMRGDMMLYNDVNSRAIQE